MTAQLELPLDLEDTAYNALKARKPELVDEIRRMVCGSYNMSASEVRVALEKLGYSALQLDEAELTASYLLRQKGISNASSAIN